MVLSPCTSHRFRERWMVPVDREEYRRWVGQAQHTLASARRDAAESDFDWACFKAQQAAESCVKGLLRGLGHPAVGHSLLRLLELAEQQAHVKVPEPVREAARTLDRHYIPPRYPDAYPAGMPYEFYDRPTAEAALSAAEAVMEFVRGQARQLGLEDPSEGGPP